MTIVPPAPMHPQEAQRLRALRELDLLETPNEEAYDDIVSVASTVTGMPICLISLVDECRQCFKAKLGIAATETPRDIAFCAYTIIESSGPMIIADARCDARFAQNPLVLGEPHIVSYVGIPLRDPESGLPIGTLCTIDHVPRQLEQGQINALAALARQVEMLFSLRLRNRQLDHALKRLQTSEANLHAALASSPVGVFITDNRGHCSFVNPAWCRIAGMDLADALGDGWVRAVHPDDQDRVKRRWYEASLNREIFVSEHRFLHPDGSIVWTTVRSAEIRQGDSAIGFVGMVVDISERKRTEVLLRESENRLLEAQAISQLGHWSYRINDQLIEWSPQVFINFGRDQALGPPTFAEFQSMIHGEDRARLMSAVALCIEQGKPYDLEHRVLRPDGSVRSMRARGRLRRDHDGEPSELTGTNQDITEEVRVRQALEHARVAAEAALRSKADFLAIMSHEIRTPLNGIIGMNELIRGTSLTTEQRDYVDAARSCGESLLSLINDILDFSKIEAGKVDLERIAFSPRALVEDAISMVAEQAHGKNLEIYTRQGVHVPSQLIGDPARIRQILLNLLGNAVKFTEVGEVVVEVSATTETEGRSQLRLAVRDTGIGIPSDRFNRLFQAFTQVDQETSRTYGGTGLGLAISHRLAELMKGSIRVRSVPGQGSEFTLTLDLPISDKSIPEPLACVPAGTSVLVVDDHPGAGSSSAEVLQRAGIAVIRCETVEEAEMVLRDQTKNPAVMIIDGGMPGMIDCSFIRRLRADQSLKLPRIILAAKVTQRSLAPSDLFSAILVRPLRRAAILEAIATCLQTPVHHTGIEPLPPMNRSKVLVAEDNPVNQMLVTTMLRKLGCQVDLAADGQLAVEACAAVEYDLVLMDCLMPRLDGYAATRIIRKARRGSARELPIIALTANALEGDRERCLAAGMDDYLTKPLTLSALEKAIARWSPIGHRP